MHLGVAVHRRLGDIFTSLRWNFVAERKFAVVRRLYQRALVFTTQTVMIALFRCQLKCLRLITPFQ